MRIVPIPAKTVSGFQCEIREIHANPQGCLVGSVITDSVTFINVQWDLLGSCAHERDGFGLDLHSAELKNVRDLLTQLLGAA